MNEHTQFGNSSAMDIEHMQSLNESLTGRKIVNTDIDNEIIQIVSDTEGSGNDFEPPKVYTTSYSSQTSMGVTDSGQLHSETTLQLNNYVNQSCFYQCDTPLNFIASAHAVPLIDLTDDQSDYDSQTSGEINDRSPSDSEGQLPKELPDIVPSDTEDQVVINFIDSPEPNNEAEHSKAVIHSMQLDYEQSQSSIEISDSSMSDNNTPPVIESSLLFGSNQMISDYQTEETLFDTTQADKENCPPGMLIVSLVSDNESQNSHDSDDQPLQDSDSQKSMDSDTQADIGVSFQPSEADKENSSEEILTVNLVSDSDSQNSVDNDVSIDTQIASPETSLNSPEEEDEANSPNILIHSIEIYKEADQLF